MKTREDLDREFADELRGLLMESFAEATRTESTRHAANGAMIYRQLIRSKELLDRIHRFYATEPAPEPQKPAVNGTAQPPRKT